MEKVRTGSQGSQLHVAYEEEEGEEEEGKKTRGRDYEILSIYCIHVQAYVESY
jgi:hypothetical protein